ncbi:hypothetical protein QR680_013962 [Steinernema hermaphroditum]|uniref:Uncharacterized protein n=1 Tax=Steinernema hermaphroditum TaxID=289476 RepID=A0AA39I8P1_9BILA|nr:hypothetical protein QR680_013962 [Steinernema hermaphroditum]
MSTVANNPTDGSVNYGWLAKNNKRHQNSYHYKSHHINVASLHRNYDQTCCDIYHSTENDVFRFHNCLIHENPKNTHIDGTRNSLTLNVRNTRKYCSYKDKHIVTNSLDFHDS